MNDLCPRCHRFHGQRRQFCDDNRFYKFMFFQVCPWHGYKKDHSVVCHLILVFVFFLLTIVLARYFHSVNNRSEESIGMYSCGADICILYIIHIYIIILYTRHTETDLVPRIVLISLENGHWMLLTRRKKKANCLVWERNYIVPIPSTKNSRAL